MTMAIVNPAAPPRYPEILIEADISVTIHFATFGEAEPTLQYAVDSGMHAVVQRAFYGDTGGSVAVTIRPASVDPEVIASTLMTLVGLFSPAAVDAMVARVRADVDSAVSRYLGP
jgi:hypothetical protein